jgi:hypothetical protein
MGAARTAAAMAVLGSLQLVAAQVQLPGWNDTFCHSPDTVLASGDSCIECCMPEAAGFTIRGWTGDDTTTSWYDPMVKPWYNMVAFTPDSCNYDGKDRPMCSACIDRETDEFRSIMNSKPKKSATTPECVCDPNQTWEEGCPGAAAPFVVGCATWCCGAWKAQNLCRLPPSGANPLPGPCHEYNARKLPASRFAPRCSADGFFNDIQVGRVPPPFPPHTPNPQPLASGMQAWCTDPYTGIQNATSAVPEARSHELNCADTVACEDFPKSLCQSPIGSRYCEWVEPIGAYGGAGCLPLEQKDRCAAALTKLCPLDPGPGGSATCLTCAGRQQSTLRSVACTHEEIQTHCTKGSDDGH